MRVLYLSACWSGFDLNRNSFLTLPYEIVERRLDLTPLDLRDVRNTKPDVIVYFGINGGFCLPKPGELRMMRDIAPTVMICPEASDQTWWRSLLETYYDREVFSLIVNIDGNKDWPGSERGMTTLTPMDHSRWGEPITWDERKHNCGFGGGIDAGGNSYRASLMKQLNGAVTYRENTPGDSYGEYRDFAKNCRAILNMANQGAGGKLHVKGRIIEAGLSGSVLLETAGSPTANWLTSGIDYLEYKDADEARAQLKHIASHPSEAQEMARSLHTRIKTEFAPEVFWKKVFERVGVAA